MMRAIATVALLLAIAGNANAQLVAPLPRIPLPKPAAKAVRAEANFNRTPAGERRNGVLTLAIDVVESAWRPEGDADPEVPVLAFTERGKAPQVPGPLVRVTAGTRVRLMLRNLADTALTITGLRPGHISLLGSICRNRLR